MKHIDKYIGIPHYFGESSHEKCDCIGLCRLFYREHGWENPLWDNGGPVTEENFSKLSTWKRLYKYCLTRMDRVKYDDLQYGDFVIFNIGGDIHTGIYVEYGKLLAMQVPTVYGKSTSTVYHRDWWTPFYKCSFRRRDTD